MFTVNGARRHLSSMILTVVLAPAVSVAGNPGLVKERPSEGRCVPTDDGFMVPFEIRIPNSSVTFRMEPIPGGDFLMGSPDTETGRDADAEGPQRKVSVEPFWMAQCEVTWAEYKQYMQIYQSFKKFEELGLRKVTDENRIDAITAPTPLYEPTFTFEYGEDDQQPAVTITQYSAKQYSKWLSAVTQLQLRLPTEAEWEYACRAGSTTAYHFGDDPAALAEYAWFTGNNEVSGAKKVGGKKPNAWGLFDMHGNAAEWVLDSFGTYTPTDGVLMADRDWVRSESPDHRVMRGGSWEFKADQCRSASRLVSDDSTWKETDPNLPKSPWWYTDDPSRGVGFRLIRPLKTVSREAMEEFWKIDSEDTQYDVEDRLSEGRGVMGIVDKNLPAAIQALEDGQ
ncbi:MAG: formylglycine-generating enzyme family protein [Planctomycetaceae bacterium]|nr:formylglycine-generating enzyme family protein [Planctomycetaceae bacterium]